MKSLVIIIALILAASGLTGLDLRIVQASTGKTLTPKALAKDLAKYDVIFFGEYHDNAAIHQLQKDILPLLNNKRELILSFEMFERDVQSDLDAYIEGWSDEAQFLQNSRPWPNYESDYKPLIEYAKKHKLSAIAANVPRRYARQLNRQGMAFLDDLELDERRWLATKLTAPNDDYKKAFYAMMGLASSTHPMMADSTSLEPMYQAQCLKDDTMAESIARALAAKPKARVIHFNGDFHSRNFLGTVSRVKTALPKLKIAVLSPSYRPDWQWGKLTSVDKETGTYLLLLPEPNEGGEK